MAENKLHSLSLLSLFFPHLGSILGPHLQPTKNAVYWYNISQVAGICIKLSFSMLHISPTCNQLYFLPECHRCTELAHTSTANLQSSCFFNV